MTHETFVVNRREVDGHVCVISPEGEIDLATAPALKSALLESLQNGNFYIVVDLAEVSHMDSTGLGVLVAFLRRLADHGRLALTGIQGGVLTLFEVTGLDAKFDIFPTVDDALAHARETSGQNA
jgi:anti-sigma B factor antagonist